MAVAPTFVSFNLDECLLVALKDILEFYGQIVFILPVERKRYGNAIGSLIKTHSRYTHVRSLKVEHVLYN